MCELLKEPALIVACGEWTLVVRLKFSRITRSYSLTPCSTISSLRSSLTRASALSTLSGRRLSMVPRQVSFAVSLQPSGIARSASSDSRAATPILQSLRPRPLQAALDRKQSSRARRGSVRHGGVSVTRRHRIEPLLSTLMRAGQRGTRRLCRRGARPAHDVDTNKRNQRSLNRSVSPCSHRNTRDCPPWTTGQCGPLPAEAARAPGRACRRGNPRPWCPRSAP